MCIYIYIYIYIYAHIDRYTYMNKRIFILTCKMTWRCLGGSLRLSRGRLLGDLYTYYDIAYYIYIYIYIRMYSTCIVLVISFMYYSYHI